MKKIFLFIASSILVLSSFGIALPVSAAGAPDCSRPKNYIADSSVVINPSSPNATESFRVSANFSFKSEFRPCIEGVIPNQTPAYYFQFVYDNYGGEKRSQSVLSGVSGLTLSAGDLKSWPQLIDGIQPTGSVVRLAVGLFALDEQRQPYNDGAVVKTQNITFQGVTLGGGGGGQGGISPSTLTGTFKVGTPIAGQTFSLTSPPSGRPTITWSKTGNLPPGLVLTQLFGSRYQLSGTPTVSGNYTFTLIAQDATSTTFAVVLGSQTYSVAVADKDGNPPPPGGGGGGGGGGGNDTGNGNGSGGGNGNDPTGTGDTGLFFNNPLEASNLPEFFIKIMNILLLLIGMLSVVMIIFGGFIMITSGGAPAQITKGKSIVTWAVAGLVVALLAFSIISIVQNLIGTK